MLNQQGARKLGREVKASLKSDRRQRAADTASAAEHHLQSGDPKEAWRCIKGWYRAVEDRAPKPCYESLAKQTAEREKLYEEVSPVGDPIPINVEHFDVQDDLPEDISRDQESGEAFEQRSSRWSLQNESRGHQTVAEGSS